jgi:hypothetical protein
VKTTPIGNGRNPPGEAIRGPARPSIAFDPSERLKPTRKGHSAQGQPGAHLVFDLGYYDYAWWAKLDAAQCRIVTRLKANTPLAVVEELPVPADGSILSDRIGHLPARQGSGRTNPSYDPMREVRVRLDTGKVITNALRSLAMQTCGFARSLRIFPNFFETIVSSSD